MLSRYERTARPYGSPPNGAGGITEIIAGHSCTSILAVSGQTLRRGDLLSAAPSLRKKYPAALIYLLNRLYDGDDGERLFSSHGEVG